MKAANYDNPLVQAFYEKVVPSLVFVASTNVATGQTSMGTATVVAHSGDADEGFIPYLATAGHLLPTLDTQTMFRLSRCSFDDPANPTSRTAEFSIPLEGSTNKSPGFIKIGDKDNLDRVDIGFIRAPIVCTDGEPWFLSDKLSDESMPVEAASKWAAEGTEVAWAGFPAIVMEIAERPQPCYYRGVVSSLLIREEFQMYLLDGHNTFGISGGPVWSIDAETNLPKLIGIISGYRYNNQVQAMPGLVFATPIQILLSSVFSDYAAQSAADPWCRRITMRCTRAGGSVGFEINVSRARRVNFVVLGLHLIHLSSWQLTGCPPLVGAEPHVVVLRQMATETIGRVNNDPFVGTSPRSKPLADSMRGNCRESWNHEILNVVGTVQGVVLFRSRRRANGLNALRSTEGRLPALHLGRQREAPRRQAAGICAVAGQVRFCDFRRSPIADTTADCHTESRVNRQFDITSPSRCQRRLPSPHTT